MKPIGILRGMESSFPEALIDYVNETHGKAGVKAEFVSLDAVRMDGEPEYSVILDRISHEVSFYRSWLKWAALKGAYIINNPFWWSADDKFIDNVIATNVGVAVPRTVILPHREHPPNTKASSFRNLKFPLAWQETFDYIGFPAFMKPHDGGGWRGVSKVDNPTELFKAYNESGTDCMMLQEAIEFTEYFRCYGIGRKNVHIMRYNPLAPHHLRYADVSPEPVAPAMKEKVERDVLALCNALGYDMNTVEFAVRDGIPYAIDFMNPAPDADRASVTEVNFQWVVKAIGDFMAEKALEPAHPPVMDAGGYLRSR
jgi:glutathione synthase/RimK-type ligase-like ATP-grasp enzyme